MDLPTKPGDDAGASWRSAVIYTITHFGAALLGVLIHRALC